MRCIKETKEGAELLLDFCAGSLDRARSSEFERHIATCGECRECVNAQRALWETLDQWKAPAVSADFNERLYSRIAEEPAGWRKWVPAILRPATPYSIWKPAALATACAVLIAGFLAYAPSAPHPRETAPQADVEKVDLDQVATALEELDMLTPVSAPASKM
jgi:anti-sigma factor RsiW